jgi:hypothetical protein
MADDFEIPQLNLPTFFRYNLKVAVTGSPSVTSFLFKVIFRKTSSAEVFGSWGPAFQSFFETIMTHGEAYRSIDRGTLVNYWRRRLAVSQQRAMASTILARLGRINSLPHHDESNWQNVVVEQSYARF